MNRCRTCKFFAVHRRSLGEGPIPDSGDCVRYPPQYVPRDADGPAGSAWPVVGVEDWCGEHRQRAWPLDAPSDSRAAGAQLASESDAAATKSDAAAADQEASQ